MIKKIIDWERIILYYKYNIVRACALVGFQLTLGLKLNPRKNLLSFVTGPNKHIIEKLQQHLIAPSPFLLLLQAPAGFGKTHLLQAACQDLVYRGSQAAYIDLREVQDFAIIRGLDRLTMICIDHLEALSSIPGSYPSLVQFLQESSARGCKVLLASNLNWPTLKNDCPSLEALRLAALTDEELTEILKIKSRERGLSLPPEVVEFILKKSSYSTGNLVKMLDHIEERLSEQARRPTVKAVKDLIKETIPEVTP